MAITLNPLTPVMKLTNSLLFVTASFTIGKPKCPQHEPPPVQEAQPFKTLYTTQQPGDTRTPLRTSTRDIEIDRSVKGPKEKIQIYHCITEHKACSVKRVIGPSLQFGYLMRGEGLAGDLKLHAMPTGKEDDSFGQLTRLLGASILVVSVGTISGSLLASSPNQSSPFQVLY